MGDVLVAEGKNGKTNIEISEKPASVGHVMLIKTNLVVKKHLEIVGKLDCSGGGCPNSKAAQFTLFQLKMKKMCSTDGPQDTIDDGTVCAASSWVATEPGAFSNPSNWQAKKVP